MSKNSTVRRWAMLIVGILVLCLIGRGIMVIGAQYVNIRGQRLEQYSCSSGGGMTGGYTGETVKRVEGGQALVCTERAEWHSQDPEIHEYLVDEAILDELESIIRKHHMNFWNGKRFTRMFVADGETTGYRFGFEKNTVRFSSQVYPAQYNDKLREFDAVIEKYLQDAQPLPGLVNPRLGREESFELTEGVLEAYVYSYSGEGLSIRILNGTKEKVELSQSYRLTEEESGKVLAEEEGTFRLEISPESWEGVSISLTERLPAGRYQIAYGGAELLLEIPFEIQ